MTASAQLGCLIKSVLRKSHVLETDLQYSSIKLEKQTNNKISFNISFSCAVWGSTEILFLMSLH